MSYEEFIEHGVLLERGAPELYNLMLDLQRKEDLCAIIYTSGSTGTPKGAMYSQEGVLAFLSSRIFEADSSDRFLSFLPLAHIYGFVMNIACIYFGTPIYYLNDVKMLAVAAQEIHPHYYYRRAPSS